MCYYFYCLIAFSLSFVPLLPPSLSFYSFTTCSSIYSQFFSSLSYFTLSSPSNPPFPNTPPSFHPSFSFLPHLPHLLLSFPSPLHLYLPMTLPSLSLQVLCHLLPTLGLQKQDDPCPHCTDVGRLLGHSHAYIFSPHNARLEQHRHSWCGEYLHRSHGIISPSTLLGMLDKQTILRWVAIVIDIPTVVWVMFLNVYGQSLTLAKC